MRVSDIFVEKSAGSATVRDIAKKAVTFKFTNLVRLIRFDDYFGDPTGAQSAQSVTKTYVLPFVRFMILKAFTEDVNAKLLSPTEHIDRVWHLMLQFPTEYAAFCDLILPASQPKRIIDHNPLAAIPTVSGARTTRLNRMLGMYRQEFGGDPDDRLIDDISHTVKRLHEEPATHVSKKPKPIAEAKTTKDTATAATKPKQRPTKIRYCSAVRC